MKAAPILITAVIAAAVGLGEWGGEEHLNRALEERQRLTQELADKKAAPAPAPEIIQEAAATPAFDPSGLISRLSSLAANGADHPPEGSAQAEAALRDSLKALGELDSLEAPQMRALLAGLENATNLSDEAKQNLLGLASITFAYGHPADALALLDGGHIENLLDRYQLTGQVQKAALSKMAAQDPAAAVEQLHRIEKAATGPVDDEIKAGLLNGAARLHPKAAFEIVPDLHLEEAADAPRRIMSAPMDAAMRNEALAALRQRVAHPVGDEDREELLKGGMNGLEQILAYEGLHRNLAWLEKAKLNVEEASAFSNSIDGRQIDEDFDTWLDWIKTSLNPDRQRDIAKDLTGKWAFLDAVTAAKWIAAAPEGALKDGAILGYADILSDYRPAEAADWALKLAPSNERTECLHDIVGKWTETDAEAAKKFAKENGLEE